MCGTDCFLMLLSVLFPPIGVWVKRGICSADSIINIALCCLGFLPGLLHAWYIILQYPDPYSYEQVPDSEGRTTTYYYVAHAGPAPPRGRNYGTVGTQPSNGPFPGQQQSGVVNAFPGPKQGAPAKGPQPGREPQYGVSQSGSGSSSAAAAAPAAPAAQEEGTGPSEPPPTYADVIKGDNKVQSP
ncbi:UPF0057-domain-containing protein [Amniculicola lignicola CBS 123094]|uniref:UPF0057-domain-containing protein n=1 Tax=Amniculicola lignicola CBS 123094 TaxID=1392246 RepID=A0A6A5VVB2_9PLEO|nr:UPF0057-domain-containing protein [Amniculicola lignicola CBS 123094]